MKTRSVWLTCAALLHTAGCGGDGMLPAEANPLPTAVNCATLSTVRSEAAEARTRIDRQRSDRAKIARGARAKFLASLALSAELQCRVSNPQADVLLAEALRVGDVARTTRSEYEAIQRWTEADLLVSDAVALLIRHLPSLPSS